MLCLRSMMQWLILLWFAESQKFIIRHSGRWTTNGQWPWLWHSAHCPTTPAIPQLWCQCPVIPFTLYFCFAFLHYIWLYTQKNFKFETYLINKNYGMFTKLHCIKYLSNILNFHCTITTKYQSNSDFLILNVKLKLIDSCTCICFCFGTWQGVGFGTPLQRQKQYAQHRVRKASEDMFELKKAKWTKPSESALMNKTKAKARRNKIR